MGAESRAESRMTYRSTTSKVERRKNKRQALLDKLSGKSSGNAPASSAQADIAIHYLQSKKVDSRQKKKNQQVTKNKSEKDLKKVKKVAVVGKKFKKGHQGNKQRAALEQIQAMQSRMKSNTTKGSISSKLETMSEQ